MWVVYVNRQSLDLVIPGDEGHKLMRFFDELGLHVVEVKYGQKLCTAFERTCGAACVNTIDDMSNEQYQSLFRFES